MNKEVTERFEILERNIELITEALEKLTVTIEKLYDYIQGVQASGSR